MDQINPKLTEFLDKNKEITLVGLVWAGFWRMYVGIMVACGLLIFTTDILGL
jgi:hypothetical protein